MVIEKPVYEEIRNKSIDDFNAGRLQIEKDFDLLPDDGCRGYVLQISFEETLPNYENFVERFQRLEPYQYYSPRKDLHTTVFEFVPVANDYQRFQEFVPKYTEICHTVLKGIKQFPIEFRGCVFTPGSGIICGYDNEVLVEIRAKIRSEMTREGLKLQERYQSKTAHVSFMGFKNDLIDFGRFRELVEQNRETYIDNVSVAGMELVVHDWFNRSATKQVVSGYEFGR